MSITGLEDSKIWCPNRNGKFSVQSAYRFAYGVNNATSVASTSFGSALFGFWKFIWHSHLPPRLRVWCWRVVLNELPTRDQLRHRKIDFESLCVLCKEYNEDLHHLLFKCQTSRPLWETRFPHREYFSFGVTLVDS